jgi:hypothetical protein
VPEWRRRLVCSQCGSRNVDMVVPGRGREEGGGAAAGGGANTARKRLLADYRRAVRAGEVRVSVERDHGFRRKMITQSGGT